MTKLSNYRLRKLRNFENNVCQMYKSLHAVYTRCISIPEIDVFVISGNMLSENFVVEIFVKGFLNYQSITTL